MKWLIFAIVAFICWGSYGPSIHAGQKSFVKPAEEAATLQIFLCVGIAYFLIAIVLPLLVLWGKGSFPLTINKAGVGWGMAAGTLGALGAFFVIMAMMGGGKPLYVMPIVFAGAPIINVIVSMIADKPKEVSPMLFVGFLLASIGAGMVLYYKPH